MLGPPGGSPRRGKKKRVPDYNFDVAVTNSNSWDDAKWAALGAKIVQIDTDNIKWGTHKACPRLCVCARACVVSGAVALPSASRSCV